MTDKKLMTAEEFIQEKYPYYDPMVAQKDVELSGEQVSSLMQAYAKYLFDNVVPSKLIADDLHYRGYNKCIDQINEKLNGVV